MNSREDTMWILSVEDDDVDHMAIERALKGTRFNAQVERAVKLKEAEELLEAAAFDCLLLDYRLPDGTGLEMLEKIRKANFNPDMAIIMLTGEKDVNVAVQAMKDGAHDYLSKSNICADALQIAITKAMENISLSRQVREARQRLEELAFFDSLTGLPNRIVFEDRLGQTIRLARRKKSRFQIAVMDMDGFKKINDEFGHQAGDAVLRTISNRMAAVVRDTDTIARFGGDEFVALLPTTENAAAAGGFAERILEAVKAPIAHDGGEFNPSLSIGLSMFPDHGQDAESLLKRADEAMYLAKGNGAGWALSQG